jgi:hypothetical protein
MQALYASSPAFQPVISPAVLPYIALFTLSAVFVLAFLFTTSVIIPDRPLRCRVLTGQTAQVKESGPGTRCHISRQRSRRIRGRSPILHYRGARLIGGRARIERWLREGCQRDCEDAKEQEEVGGNTSLEMKRRYITPYRTR